MRIKIGVVFVDGATTADLSTDDPKHAISFLKSNDHEGSGISIFIESFTHEEVYELLDYLKKRKKGKK